MDFTTSSSARDMSPITERFHKTDIINELADTTSLNRKQVIDVLDELAIVIERHVIDGSVGEFILAGLFKVTTVKKEAKHAHTGVNPFTGKSIKFSAKPARTSVKIHPLKGLKDMAY